MKVSNNVILFPKNKVENSAKLSNLEDIQRNIEMMRHYHIQETILNLTPLIFNQLDVAGFIIDDDENDDVKDGAFIVEALRSYMLKYYGDFHPFQIIAQNVFEKKKDEEESYKIVDELVLNLKNPESSEEEKGE